MTHGNVRRFIARVSFPPHGICTWCPRSFAIQGEEATFRTTHSEATSLSECTGPRHADEKFGCRRITDALRIAVPQFDSLQISTDETGKPHLQGRYSNWRGTGSWQDERELSDGMLRLVGLLWTLARAQRSNGSQILLTTHSPDLLADEGVRPDEVLVLSVTDDGSVGSLLSDDPESIELIELGFALDDVVRKRSAPANIEQLALADLLRG